MMRRGSKVLYIISSHALVGIVSFDVDQPDVEMTHGRISLGG